ncbi:MAG: UDP-glucose/GDP-mannose dehydrogenase family protein [Nitrospirae bacterium]|nr:UDP-glucose/GDP-mannose dehydrogenase family protein [Nitrospirota bacterium]
MDICVIGTGYVGLVTGTCLAETGNRVVCMDIDEKRIRSLEHGQIPIFEPGLKELVTRNVKEGRLRFTTDLRKSLDGALLCFIAVGTPPLKSGKSDLSAMFRLARDIGKYLTQYTIVIVKSTVPVGTTMKVKQIIQKSARSDFAVAMNPEFLKEGSAVDDFMRPDRVVVGVERDDVAGILKRLYAPLVRTEHPIIVMDIASAELTKYAANAYLATRISYINEVANICERVGADIEMVRKGMGGDARIGYQFLFPGVGYGGSCFPKDVDSLAHFAKAAGYRPDLVGAVNSVNRRQRQILFQKVVRHFKGSVAGKTFAVWGLSFKPKTDDVREAPSIDIIRLLLQARAKVRVYDPVAMPNTQKIFGHRLQYTKKPLEAARGAHALLILTEWQEFRSPDFAQLRETMKSWAIFDGRNLFDPAVIRNEKFFYYAFGRPPVTGSRASS